ncbi:MAG: hypothetical protein GWN47_07905 [Woeseiaceae bacterium]|nr:hypothetical protein [Woeseiaceae bacterium]
MSIFEFLTVAISIVLALGLSLLISSIPHVFDPKKRDWLHSFIFLLLIFSHVVVWWRVWMLNSVSSWNIIQFMILIGSPLSLYLAATALVSTTPHRIDDWKAYFSDRSQWFFAAFAATIFFGILRSYYILGVMPEWWGFLALAVNSGAALSKSREIHIAVAFSLIVFLGILLTRDFNAI